MKVLGEIKQWIQWLNLSPKTSPILSRPRYADISLRSFNPNNIADQIYFSIFSKTPTFLIQWKHIIVIGDSDINRLYDQFNKLTNCQDSHKIFHNLVVERPRSRESSKSSKIAYLLFCIIKIFTVHFIVWWL
jgi:hypothetical protein